MCGLPQMLNIVSLIKAISKTSKVSAFNQI